MASKSPMVLVGSLQPRERTNHHHENTSTSLEPRLEVRDDSPVLSGKLRGCEPLFALLKELIQRPELRLGMNSSHADHSDGPALMGGGRSPGGP